ncbi:MAG: hypothetical protein JSS79_19100 [Bacteroidetes bacterium]|nr:hypothetical protein [Bacteroidota bacterium]
MNIPSGIKTVISLAMLVAVVVFIYFFTTHQDEKMPSSPTDSLSTVDSISLPSASTAGAKPQANAKDNSVPVVAEYIHAQAANPSTVEFLEWSALSAEGAYWKVRCKYVSTTSFHAEVTTNAWFYIQHQRVVYTKVISKI